MGIGNGCTLELKVDRVGGISLSTSGGAIRATLPVRAWGRVDWSTTKRIKFGIGSKGITVRHHEDFDSRLTVTAELRPRIASDWSLATNSNLSHHWNQKPTLTIGPAKVRITGHADPEVRKQLGRLAAALNQELAKLVDLRPKVAKVWHELHVVRQVSSCPDVWFRSTPMAFGASEFTSVGNSLRLDARVVCRLETIVGAIPTIAEIRPLLSWPGLSRPPVVRASWST